MPPILTGIIASMSVGHKNSAEIFSTIYANNSWGGDESRSGKGSSLATTEQLRRGLEEWFEKLGIKTLVDAPCGDMNWIKHLNYGLVRYTGVDIVRDAIEELVRSEKSSVRHFQVGDITTDALPSADALLCRDCLVHLPFEMVISALELWMKSSFRYLFLTTFPEHDNRDCALGRWRPLNLQAPPFSFPDPIALIHEANHAERQFRDKAIGVWSLEALRRSYS